MKLLHLLLAALILISGCANNDETPKGYTEKEYYDLAQEALRFNQWERSIEMLQSLEENFPFGQYAEQAQLELIYAYYRSYDHDLSVASADRFIRLHPQHPNVDYAYYMQGLATFTQEQGALANFVPSDRSLRDPGAARESFSYFSQLLAKFPDSRYAPDAQKRMLHLRNLLARTEIQAANYYLKIDSYVAAANRGRYVVENFQETPAVPDALAVMVHSYHQLEMNDLKENALKVLVANYPDHPALNDGRFNYDYANRQPPRGLLGNLTLGLFNKDNPMGFDSREIYNREYRFENAIEEEREQKGSGGSIFDIFKFRIDDSMDEPS